MKFIKRYKVFESGSIWQEPTVIEEVEDILDAELEEKELVWTRWNANYYSEYSMPKESLIVSVRDKYFRFFRTEDVLETSERLASFLGDEYEIHIGSPRDLVYGNWKEFIEDFRGEELYNLTIYIYKK